MHKKALEIKIGEIEKTIHLNNEIKKMVKELIKKINSPLKEIEKILNISDVDNFEKTICRLIIKQLNNDSRIKAFKEKNIEIKKLLEKEVELNETLSKMVL